MFFSATPSLMERKFDNSQTIIYIQWIIYQVIVKQHFICLYKHSLKNLDLFYNIQYIHPCYVVSM